MKRFLFVTDDEPFAGTLKFGFKEDGRVSVMCCRTTSEVPGLIEKHGSNVNVVFLGPFANENGEEFAIAQNLSKRGIKVNLIPREVSSIKEEYRNMGTVGVIKKDLDAILVAIAREDG